MSIEAEKGVIYHSASKSSIPSTEDEKHVAMSVEERSIAEAAARYGYGPLAGKRSQLSPIVNYSPPGKTRAPAPRKFANPAPLGLCAFALTTFILSLINMQARNVRAPNLVIGSAFAYGGFVQLLTGMWEMASGNTFGATTFSSYGAFWISYGIVFTPGGFDIVSNITKIDGGTGLNNVIGFWLIAWFIFSTMMLSLTVKTNWACFLLFVCLDMTYLLLAIGYFQESAPGVPYAPLIKAGGFFGLLAAFLAWYGALAELADETNSFIRYPVGTLPWVNAGRAKAERDMV
ncbi:Meiotically up-regulated protein 86 protein [Ophidiomyces ophidiicola]|nr:Meiotically up-regulated protein 86 protein [Ophidiomyces ophidiicola]KAI1907027.1 Meiotically up-regulated protein 86 protein [Ophidiomyces ophidiicola]KAI1926246.1 Meiotically up-regulated protein 86 protein [Ophidiomyces ophidiicola]KAI1956933.1 Meiotically up-regulated protein 86 protein [Ophidiomyces ophidiicola]KAI2006328.1 Meiotically up-regulated protein 86 protein [Ophidiomyces ophidiicola]